LPDAFYEGSRGGLFLARRLFGCDLAVMLVEVEGAVKLGLFGKKLLEARFMLEGAV